MHLESFFVGGADDIADTPLAVLLPPLASVECYGTLPPAVLAVVRYFTRPAPRIAPIFPVFAHERSSCIKG